MPDPFPPPPLVIAHRGFSARHPENTMAAFAAAERAGADAVELDVRVTADGVPVVLHDVDVGATTDGAGPVHTLTLSQVKRLDASGGRGTRQEVPTLMEVLESIGIGVDIEVKNIPGEPDFDAPGERALVATLRALEETAFAGPILVTSFNWLTIERCRRLAPDLSTGLLTVAGIAPAAALTYATEAGHAWILPQALALQEAGPDVVAESHAAGVRVGTWTVDDPEVMGTLFGWGVDAVATNDPGRGVAVRDGGSGQD